MFLPTPCELGVISLPSPFDCHHHITTTISNPIRLCPIVSEMYGHSLLAVLSLLLRLEREGAS